MPLADKSILVLNDGRAGNYKQIEAITEFLKNDFEIHEFKIDFNIFSKLPNFLHYPRFLPIRNFKSIELLNINPNFIISCGRRSASFSIYLNKKFPNAKSIHLLKPNLSHKLFDYIITPIHDNYRHAFYEYIFPPTLTDINTLKNNSKGFEHLKLNDKEKLCIIIGGSSKNKKLKSLNYNKFNNFIKFITSIKNKHILLTTSRRTDESLINIINKNCKNQPHIETYLYKDNDNLNPYNAFLYYADQIMVTGDSISMVADSIMTQKPVIIYDDFAGKKQLLFLNKIYQENYAVKYTQNLNNNDILNLKKQNFNEAKIIADKIKQLI